MTYFAGAAAGRRAARAIPRPAQRRTDREQLPGERVLPYPPSPVHYDANASRQAHGSARALPGGQHPAPPQAGGSAQGGPQQVIQHPEHPLSLRAVRHPAAQDAAAPLAERGVRVQEPGGSGAAGRGAEGVRVRHPGPAAVD